MDRIFVVVTLDCERLRQDTHDRASGPTSWQLSEDAISGYCEIARAKGLPVTLFLHPEVANAHAGLLLELERDGSCIDGLHLHPWKFADAHYRTHLGLLDEQLQTAVISEAVAEYRTALGRRPLYFRPGTFSANDATYRVLVRLGFRGGSCSVPERVYPDIGAIWTANPRDPHRPNQTFRNLPGVLPFGEMPLTCDFSQPFVSGLRRGYRDLRPDDTDFDHRSGVANILDQLVERKPRVPVINIVTHNDHDYKNSDDPVRRRYVELLSHIVDECGRRGIEPVGATIADIADLVLDCEGEGELSITLV